VNLHSWRTERFAPFAAPNLQSPQGSLNYCNWTKAIWNFATSLLTVIVGSGRLVHSVIAFDVAVKYAFESCHAEVRVKANTSSQVIAHESHTINRRDGPYKPHQTTTPQSTIHRLQCFRTIEITDIINLSKNHRSSPAVWDHTVL